MSLVAEDFPRVRCFAFHLLGLILPVVFLAENARAALNGTGFVTTNSTGGAVAESQVNNIACPGNVCTMSASLTVQDGVNGLAVSTYTAPFAGDGHDGMSGTSGFGVLYSTNAGTTWIDGSWSPGAASVTGETQITALAVYGPYLYAGTNPNGKVGVWNGSWSVSNGGLGDTTVAAMAVFNGSLYAGTTPNGKVASYNGTSWSGVTQPLGTVSIGAMAVYNGKLYVSGAGSVWSYDGATWTNLGTIFSGATSIPSLVVLNGALYAADNPTGRVSFFDGFGWTSSNGGLSVLSGDTVYAMAVYNNQLYVGGSGSGLTAVFNGSAWVPLNGGAAFATGDKIKALTVFRGRLYAAGSTLGKLAVLDGTRWLPVNGGYPLTYGALSMAGYSNQLYVGEITGNYIGRLNPTVAALGGVDGSAGPQTLSASGVNLSTSVTAAICAGANPCFATNQIEFAVSDMGGNSLVSGPYAVLTDTIVSVAVTTPTMPTGFVNLQPNFLWAGPSTTTIAALGPSASYYLQVSNNDPTFSPANIVIFISTPAVLASSNTLAAMTGSYISTYTLTDNTTFYWRVAVARLGGLYSPWSSTASFVTNLTPPLQVGAFSSFNSAGLLLTEAQFNNMGVPMAQLSVQDPGGLAVSTVSFSSAPWPSSGFAGDGHNTGGQNPGFGVMYSTTAGRVWIDFSSLTMLNNGAVVGTSLRSMAVFNGNLYAADSSVGKVYMLNADSNTWTTMGSAITGSSALGPLLVAANGRMYTGDFTNGKVFICASACSNAGNWVASNNGNAVAAGGIAAMAVFNGKIFVADKTGGKVYVSPDGASWWPSAFGFTLGFPAAAAGIQSMGVFNGRLFAGDQSGRIFASVDGSSWSMTNGGTAVGAQISALAAFNGRFFAADQSNQKVFVSTDGGTSWTGTNGGGAAGTALGVPQGLPGASILSMTTFDGKLYAGDSLGRLWVTTGTLNTAPVGLGYSWIQAFSATAPVTGNYNSGLYAVAPLNGRLYFADATRAYQVWPVSATLSGVDGSIGVETLSVSSIPGRGMSLAPSTNTVVCAGLNISGWFSYAPVGTGCGATNQVIFTVSDRGGNVLQAGPYAIIVSSVALSTPSYPANGAYVNVQPNFNWIGPSTAAIASLPFATSFYLQVSNNDPNFAPASIVIAITTPVFMGPGGTIVASTATAFVPSGYVSTYTLANATTYYWRVSIINGQTYAQSPWSSTFTFMTDFIAPLQSGVFSTLNSTGGVILESQFNSLALGVTAQINIVASSLYSSGLVVSTAAKAFAGDGHSNPGVTTGWGVIYSTNAGASWLDYSTITAMNSGNGYLSLSGLIPGYPVRAMAVFNNKLYAADGTNGKVYVSPDGNSWAASNGGNPVGTALRSLAAFNGRLFAADGAGTQSKVYVMNSDSVTWSATNANGGVGQTLLPMTVFNGRLVVGEANGPSAVGRVYVSTSGDIFVCPQCYNAVNTLGMGGQVQTLTVFNGKLYAGDSYGKVLSSVDGSTWTWTYGNPAYVPATNYGQVAPAATPINALVAFNNKLLAADNGGRVYASTGAVGPNGEMFGAGVTLNPTNAQAIWSLSVFNGRVYAGDAIGRIFVSTEGTTWLPLSGANVTTQNPVYALAPFNGKLYAADGVGKVFQITPVSATLTTGGLAAVDGVTAVTALTAIGLNFAPSTNSLVNLQALGQCGGTWPCGATDQVMFTATDRAGNVGRFGPFAVQVDSLALTGISISTPVLPANGAFVGAPLMTAVISTYAFAWLGPSTATIAGMPGGASYYLQIAVNDPSFNPQNVVMYISTPATVISTMSVKDGGAWLYSGSSTLTFTNNTTYYWRVALVNGSQGTMGPWSSTSSFVTDYAPPSVSAIFGSLSATGSTLLETQFNNLLTGVTAQISVSDAASGLAVSTSVLASGGDGHNGPSLAPGYGVMYSTSAGRFWIDFTASTAVIPGAYQLLAMAVLNGKLYVLDGSPNSGGKVFYTSDGVTWSGQVNGGVANGGSSVGSAAGQNPILRSITAFNGRLFAGDTVGRVWVSGADPTAPTWTQANQVLGAGMPIAGAYTQIRTLLPFNGKLYAGDYIPNLGRVYVSTSGDTWTNPIFIPGSGVGIGMGGPSQALVVFNNRMFSGDNTGRVQMTADGSTWTWANGGLVVGSSITDFAVFNNKLFASDGNGRVYVSTSDTFYGTNGLGAAGNPLGAAGAGYPASLNGPTPVNALAPFNGKLYAGDQSGHIYVSTDGNTWNVTNSSYAVGSAISSLASFNGKLYATDSNQGYIYTLTPIPAALSGSDGTTSSQLLKATSLNLVSSTNTMTCGGVMPCGATNQVIFTASDRAGNVLLSGRGPYAILVDALTAVAVSTPAYPSSGTSVNIQPNFNWFGPSTTTLAALPAYTSYYLQVSNNDPNFSPANIVINISTPAVLQTAALVPSTTLPAGFGAYVSTYTLSNLTTYYWRVQIVNGAFFTQSPWSSTSSFVTDFSPPLAVSAFTSLNAANTPVGETGINGLALGVTAQINVQDAGSGLVVSTVTLPFAGDGHGDPNVTGGYGVIYSTNAGQTWIDASTITTANYGNTIFVGASQLRGLAVVGDKIFATDGGNGKVYWSADGFNWNATNSGIAPGGLLRPLLVAANGRIYTGDNAGKIWVTANGGTSWSASNNNLAVATSAILSLASFNSRLYAGDLSGRVYVSTDGNSWTATLVGGGVLLNGFPSQQVGGAIQALAAFNGRLYAGDNKGQIFTTVDGSTWNYSNGYGASWAMLPVGSSITALTVFNNKLVAVDAGAGAGYGKVYVSTSGDTWNTGVQPTGGAALQSLAAFNGKLYAGDGTGRLYVSTEGSTWLPTNGGYAIAASTIFALAPFNGRLYAADNLGYVYQITPVTATLTGADGTTFQQTLAVTGLRLVNSTNNYTGTSGSYYAPCGGIWPCGATNQVVFTAADLSGNTARIGPFGIQVDAAIPVAISTPSFPVNGAFVSTEPNNFNWSGPSTATLAALAAGTSYFLQVSNNDPSFSAGNIVAGISTPAWSAVSMSTSLPMGLGAYLSTYTLQGNTTFYWRVALVNSADNALSPWSQVFSFVSDPAPPVQSGAFTHTTSTGGVLFETQVNSLAAGVTAQIGLLDIVGGLVVSTASLPFAGGGHNNPGTTGGFGVIYSTNAGQTWIDVSTVTNMNGGVPIAAGLSSLRGMAVFNNRLYVAEGATSGPNLGKVYSSADGNVWSASAGGAAGAIRALVVFNGRLYAADNNATGKVYSSADGSSWSPTNGGAALGFNANIAALATFNGRLYAGDAGFGRIYVSTDGNVWSMAQGGIAPFQTQTVPAVGQVQTLAAFNGRLYAGDHQGRVYVSVDGSSWTAINNYGQPLGGASNITALVAFSNRIYAVDGTNGKIFFMNPDGNTWTQASGGPQGIGLNALIAFNGKVYSSDNAGRVWVSTEGSTWYVINSSYPVSAGGAGIVGLSPFNGKLYAGDNNGRVYQINPVSATLTTGGLPAADGTTAVSSITAYGLNLYNSTNSLVCAGNWPCGATNQVIFTVFERAGLAQRLGPFAILVDTITPNGLSISTPSLPANGAYVGAPLGSPFTYISSYSFVWYGPSTATVAGLPPGSSYYLQISYPNDPAFTLAPTIAVSTPAVVITTTIPTAVGAWFVASTTLTLANNTTYYWRVAMTNGVLGAAGGAGPWSSTFSFVTDFAPPAVWSSFQSINTAQTALSEGQFNNLLTGVTAQIGVSDAQSGLAVSTSVLTLAGDGHEGPYQAGGFGVMYSTNAGRTWIDFTAATTTVPGASQLFGLTVLNGRLYAVDGSVGSGGRVFHTADGNTWATANGGNSVGFAAGQNPALRSLTAFNGRLFAGDSLGRVWVSGADPTAQTWTQANNGQAVGAYFRAMTSFNGRLYAGDDGIAGFGRVYVSTSGDTWTNPQSPLNFGMGGPVQALAVFNNRLYSGDTSGRIQVTADGSTWTWSNGGLVVGSSITTFAVFNNKLFAGDGVGKVYVSTSDAWYPTNGGPLGTPLGNAGYAGALLGATTITALAPFNGKLYAGDQSGHIYVSTDGASWNVTNSSYAVGSNISGLAAFNGKLYASDANQGFVYALTPAAVALTGSDGTTSGQTLKATSLNLVNSTNTLTCGGGSPCGATNQVIFTVSDRAGNVLLSNRGPWAVLVDAATPFAISTPAFPVNGGATNIQPNFNWFGPSTATLASLPPYTSYYLQVSNNDPNFGPLNIVVAVSTPAVTPSTTLPAGFGTYISTFSLGNLTTYYWRVSIINGAFGSKSPWSSVFSFTTDFSPPTTPGGMTSINAVGANITEAQINGLSTGVTAQLNVQDAGAGLAVSTGALAFAGDGHDAPSLTAGYGVIYSTNAGQTWIDASTITVAMGGTVIYSGASQLRGLAVAGGKLFAVDGSNGRIYSSADGLTWGVTNSGVAPGGLLRPLLAGANGRIYTGDNLGRIWVTANGGASWSASNNGLAVATSAVLSLASFNGRLYAGDVSGRVYVSTDGNSWTATLVGGSGGSQQVGGPIQALTAFNGRLYAADFNGRIFNTVDGSTWNYSNSILNANVGTNISALTVFNNKLVAVDSTTGKVFVSTSGADSWNSGVIPTLGVGITAGNALQSLAAFNGKLYAGDGTGRLYVSTEGSTWLPTNGNYAIAASTIYALAPFNGKLYAADNLGYVYQITPVSATLPGGAADGTTALQTLTATGLNLVNSTNNYTGGAFNAPCAGVWPCGATNQILFTAADLSGNTSRLGPYVIQVDATTSLAISTPSFPINGAFVSTEPNNFNWTGPSTAILAGLPFGTSYYLQVARNDAAFGSANIVVSVSTPAWSAVSMSTTLPMGLGAYLSTFTLANNTTFYWRVQVLNGSYGTQSPWSQTFSFVSQLLPPALASPFTSATSTGGLLGELQVNTLAAGVTAQIGIQDVVGGLVVSTAALPFAGGGHNNPGTTGGFGVIYSTNAGQMWIDVSTVTNMNAGAPIVAGLSALRGMAVFNNKLYIAEGATSGPNLGKVYSSPDGNTWSVSNNGVAFGGGAIRALVVFNNKLYAADNNATGKVYATADGTNWGPANGNAPLGPSANLATLAVFNGRLYAGDAGLGRIYVSTSGDTWVMAQGGVAPFQTQGGAAGAVQALSTFNGRLYAGDGQGKIYVSVDGSSWTAINNYGQPLGGGSNITALVAFNNRLYAVDGTNGKIFFMNPDGNTWTQANGGPQGIGLNAPAAFNGKLYSSDNNGRVWVSTEGSTWYAINSSYTVSAGIAGINGLSPFNAQLYAADNNGRVYQINPVSATLTTGGLPAVDGTTAISSITAYGLKLFNSTNSQTCG
ncbi:MAG: hypothetical protein NTX64_01825, partial [Elusimicrobia bacterium]|nr:hypothetical protein [Elusimicrobiota bacterium]